MGAIKVLLIVLIILIIAFFGLLVFSSVLEGDFFEYYPELNNSNNNSSSNNLDNTSNNSNNTNNTPDNTENSPLGPGFEDNAYFSVTYPAPLSVDKSPVGGYPAIDLTYASFSLLITYDNSQGVLTEDYVGPFGREMDKQEPDFEFGSADPVTVDGVAGYEIILLPIYEDTDHIGIEAFAIKGNALLYYQEIIDIDGYETSKAKADSIIATIKIK